MIERWMLIPQSVEDLYTGNLDDADVMMRRPLPSGNTKDRGPKRTRRNIWLTDAGWEAVTRCAAKRGLVRSAYVAEVIHEQVRIANESGWPLPDGITNESVEKEIRDVLRKTGRARYCGKHGMTSQASDHVTNHVLVHVTCRMSQRATAIKPIT